MGYKNWFDNHVQKHYVIVEKLLLQNFTQEEIIKYFEYENMLQNEVDFCPLYAKEKKCHDIKELNCYMCGCSNFRFNDKGLGNYDDFIIKSRCSIANGESKAYNKIIHQDCSKCSVPHYKSFIEKNFNSDWKIMMQQCEVK